jgi:hypothetical protein
MGWGRRLPQPDLVTWVCDVIFGPASKSGLVGKTCGIVAGCCDAISPGCAVMSQGPTKGLLQRCGGNDCQFRSGVAERWLCAVGRMGRAHPRCVEVVASSYQTPNGVYTVGRVCSCSRHQFVADTRCSV